MVPPFIGTAIVVKVLMHEKAVTCLLEEVCVLDKPCSGMSYSAVGLESNVNESPIYTLSKVSVNRNMHKTRLCIDPFMRMWPEAGRRLTWYFP